MDLKSRSQRVFSFVIYAVLQGERLNFGIYRSTKGKIFSLAMDNEIFKNS